MDSSLVYMSAFLLCLFLSWYLYKVFFLNSGLENRFSDVMNSKNRFVFGLIVMMIMPITMLSMGYVGSAVVVYLLAGISVLFIPNLRAAFVIFSGLAFLACFSPVASDIEPFPLVIIGSMLLQSGFAKMHEFQLMRNIPRSKIRSVAAGAVEISGTIVPKNVLTTPYSKSPCVYCLSELETYIEHGDSDSDNYSEWRRIPGPSFKVPFWVKDETGQIMVDPEGAEFRIPDGEFGMLKEDDTPADADDAVSENLSPKQGDRRYVEQILAPNDPVFILGTATIRKDGATEQLIIQAGPDSPFIISETRQQYAAVQDKWDMLAGLSYGLIIFITGFLGILYLSNLL